MVLLFFMPLRMFLGSAVHCTQIVLQCSLQVRLTIMIEDPREVERRRLLEIEDADAPTRDDLVAALDQVCSSSPFHH